ncbi:MAG: DUF2817 domain-containing protein [Bacteroidetes bacterium]|jgi:hypothetical protein|nr:DUF2817 domain-containing protein [Bacteroidota bacterium]MBT4398573.1 DUF2817 domain-containing protein [Bacteroidota bacterium]MBT4409084.1 DUF2817 domain-containing protein [Bacteroidota bacterium]MBT7094165.1 DUF2817 domain-containing protein [Bacteroidota bacterium]MBT7463862.1 DUF2817 domain-containing protein [Bacteroidota bacterium]
MKNLSKFKRHYFAVLFGLIVFCCQPLTMNAQTAIPDGERLKYFDSSYEDCRQQFISDSKQLSKKYNDVKLMKINVPSKLDDELFVDVCYVPAQGNPKRLLILSSGIHGIEGYVGNAIQELFVKEFLDDKLMEETGVLLLHGMNPYGFKYLRRVTENNIDLNRNSGYDNELYKIINSGYGDLYDFLNPTDAVRAGSMKNRFFFVTAIRKILQASLPVLRQAVLQGQYQYTEGLYFGGDKQEPQIAGIGPLIEKVGTDYPIIMNIDLHTGYGESGKLHFFPNPIEDSELKKQTEDIFKGYQIDWGDSDDFYTITGDFSGYIGKLLAGKTHISMTFEYGTMDSQKTMGSIKSIHNMILENQGAHHGYKRTKDQKKVEKRFLEMYYPSDPKWRTKIMNQSSEVLNVALQQFNSL